MNIQTKWKNGRALNENESYQLIDDLFAEQVDMNKDKRKDIIAWFLRNYMAMPFSFIAEALEYSQSSDASRAVSLLRASTGGYPVSLYSDYRDIYQTFKLVADKYYGTNNCLLELNSNEDLENACLWSQADILGYKDTSKNAPEYTPTPKSQPTMVSVNDMLTEMEDGSCWSVWLSDWEIKSTI